MSDRLAANTQAGHDNHADAAASHASDPMIEAKMKAARTPEAIAALIFADKGNMMAYVKVGQQMYGNGVMTAAQCIFMDLSAGKHH